MKKNIGIPVFVLAMISLTSVFSVIGHHNNAKWRMLVHARMMDTLEQQAGQEPSRKQACIMKAWAQFSSDEAATLSTGCDDVSNVGLVLAKIE
ncbi:MAG: hypothetical protein ACR2QG_01970 [Gammaproteobacteria bacterium]